MNGPHKSFIPVPTTQKDAADNLITELKTIAVDNARLIEVLNQLIQESTLTCQALQEANCLAQTKLLEHAEKIRSETESLLKEELENKFVCELALQICLKKSPYT